jgi:phage replication O-like protein O
MAKPQLEDGYIRIAREIYIHLCAFRIPGEVRSIIDAVIIKTYGYQKTSDKMSFGQLAQLTGIRRDNIKRPLRKAFSGVVGPDPVVQADPKVRSTRTPKLGSARTPTKEKKDNKKITVYPDYPTVLLSEEERDKLIKEFGEEGARQRCEALYLYMGSTGKNYKSHYLTILNWDRMEKKRSPVKAQERMTAAEALEGLDE